MVRCLLGGGVPGVLVMVGTDNVDTTNKDNCRKAYDYSSSVDNGSSPVINALGRHFKRFGSVVGSGGLVDGVKDNGEKNG